MSLLLRARRRGPSRRPARSRRSGCRAVPRPGRRCPSAVPWSGEVRTNGSPRVTFTASSKSQRLHRDQRLVVVHAQGRVVAGAGAGHGTWCRPAAGRRRRCPSARSRRSAGTMIRASSSPIAPPSPACGLSPATASRGRAMPKSRRSASATIRACAHDACSAPAAAAPRPAAMCTVSGTTRSDGPGQHHHRPCAAGELGQELGVAGKAEAGGVERRLVDRVGDHGRGGPGAGQRHRPRRCWRSPRRRVAGPGGPGVGRDPLAQRQHRQGVRRTPPPPRPGRRSRGSACRRPDPPQPLRVVESQEHRARCRQPPPGREQDLAADAGGLAHGHRQWRQSWRAMAQTASSTVTGTWSLGLSQPRAARVDLGGHQVRRQLGRQPDMVEPPAAVGRRPVLGAVGPPSVELLARRDHRAHRVDEAVGRLQLPGAPRSRPACARPRRAAAGGSRRRSRAARC